MKHYLTQFRGFRIPGRKTLPVNFTQRADKGVAVLAADYQRTLYEGNSVLRGGQAPRIERPGRLG